MNVVFRVDASNLIGTGHVIRCRTLASALQLRGAHIRFITRKHFGHLAEVLTTLDGESVPYNGGFERKGLIAAPNRSLAKSICTWVQQNHKSTCHDDDNFTTVLGGH